MTLRSTLAAIVCLLILGGAAAPFLAAAPDADISKAIAFAIEGQYQPALQIFQQRLKLHPEDASLNYYAGICWFFLKDKEKAGFYLRQSVRKEAPFPEAYYWLAQLQLSLDDRDAASSTIQRGLSRFPQNENLTNLYHDLNKSTLNSYWKEQKNPQIPGETEDEH